MVRVKNQTELRRVKKEMSGLKKRFEEIQESKNEPEASWADGRSTSGWSGRPITRVALLQSPWRALLSRPLSEKYNN